MLRLVCRTMVCSALMVALLLSASSCARAQGAKQPEVPDGVTYEPGVTYCKVGDIELKLDLARPTKVIEPRPCIVMIHGGGWRGGDRSAHSDATVKLADQGYVAATVSYRFAQVAPFPAQVEDVKAAIRFLRANATKYGLDPNKIGAVGFSAGAHLSMLLGTMDKEDGLEGNGGNLDQSSKVQAVVAFFGPTDLAADDYPEAVVFMIDDLVGAKGADGLAMKKKASPITYVSKGDAPTLIFHGTKDRLVPWNQATKMADALDKHGVPGRVELLVGADHGWGGIEIIRTLEQTMKFFDEHLKK